MKIIACLLFVAVASIAFSGGIDRTVSAALPLSGAEVFKNNCARCHGENGKGGDGPDLTDAQRKQKWTESDERIVNKVTNGGRRMPAFNDKLSAEDIKAVAGFVRSL